MTIKEMVYNTLCNHKNCTSGWIANILNIHRYSVLRALSELIKEGSVRQQKGQHLKDEMHNYKFRSYKLVKTKYTPIKLFEEQEN